jgi:hypothetical protein
MKGGVKMKSKKLAYNKILVLFSIIAVSVLMTGCDDPPIVLNFSASPSTINQGESSTLTWSVSDADTVTITPVVGTVASSDSTPVSPVVTTVYTLTATNSTGSVTATVTVNVQALPVHNLSKNTYYNTIQAALDDADSGNTIEVADGTYDETICFPSGKKVILQSVNGPSSTTIRGDHNSFTVNLSNSLPGTTIEGFTITHDVELMGGGIFNDMGNLTIYNCAISNNDGGGIENSGTLTITGASTVSGNTAFRGGGISNWSTLTITGASTVSGNTADYYGGGIYNYGTLTIEGESTVSGNSAAFNGGGIENWSTLTITGASTVSGNSAASNGGGIYIDVGSFITTIGGSTISGNSAVNNGGGIYIYSGSPTIGGSSSAEKNTICGNYKSGNSPSLDQQIRGLSGDLYGTYKNTNYIYTNCPF